MLRYNNLLTNLRVYKEIVSIIEDVKLMNILK